MTFSTTGFAVGNPTILYESDGELYFNFMAVPEPGLILALSAGAMLGASGWRRLRKPVGLASEVMPGFAVGVQARR